MFGEFTQNPIHQITEDLYAAWAKPSLYWGHFVQERFCVYDKGS